MNFDDGPACGLWTLVLINTVVMLPILVLMYVRLARREEREAVAEFGNAYARFIVTTPVSVPHLILEQFRRLG